MYSQLVPFENIVQAVSDATGHKNLRNQYPFIRRIIRRVLKDIGYGGSLLLKRIKYSVADGTILKDINGGPGKVRLPEDFVEIEEIGSCYEGLCPNAYNKQGNYLFLCQHFDEFHLMYYAMLCDGNGNPVVTENHEEAIISGILFRMYQPKLWNKEGDRGTYLMLEDDYEDRVAEARGADVMPNSPKEWAIIAQKLKMSQRDLLIYDNNERCYDCIPLYQNNEILDPNSNTTDDMVYYWQYSDLSKDITDAVNINQLFLDAQQSESVETFINGFVVPYSTVGRIGFAITNVDEDYYQIIDVLENDITDIVFDKYYDSVNRTQIYISKEIYSHGNIYYKLILN